MKAVATINGHKIYSDKKIKSIINGQVYFTDGSMVDVDNGKMVNKGKGSISLDRPEAGETKEKTFGPETFRVNSVCFDGLMEADVKVETWNKPDVQVLIKGTGSAVDRIKVNQIGSELLISCEEKNNTYIHGNIIIHNRSSSFQSIISGGNIIISNGDLQINGINCQNDEYDTKVSVKVPKGTAISVIAMNGNIQIGDTEGPIRVNTNCGDVSIGKVTDTQIQLVGSSNITVNEVNGDLSIELNGSGEVEIKNGRVKNLLITLSGSGDVDFGGTAINANLSLSGSGDITVSKVINRPLQRCAGSGDISIGNW